MVVVVVTWKICSSDDNPSHIHLEAVLCDLEVWVPVGDVRGERGVRRGGEGDGGGGDRGGGGEVEARLGLVVPLPVVVAEDPPASRHQQ